MKDACEGQITLHGFLLNSAFVPSPAPIFAQLDKILETLDDANYSKYGFQVESFNARHKIEVNGN